MNKVDYLIVGFGIAGLSLAETLRQHNKSFLVIADTKNGATATSGGVLNPTVLKRFTAAWKAQEFQEKAIPFYKGIERYLDVTIISEVKIERLLKSVEEQNDWTIASDRNELKAFLEPNIAKATNSSIYAPFKLGAVRGGHQLKPAVLLSVYSEKLKEEEKLMEEEFDFDQLKLSDSKVHYKNYSATQIVFAEGARIINNPFYPYHAPFTTKSVFIGNKGDYIIIKAPELRATSILKGGMMCIPLENDHYKVGATYDRHEYDTTPSLQNREEICTKLRQMITCPFEVVDQVTGIRPTIKDRRPIIGALKDRPQIAFLNGLGTRGLSMAPLVSYWLFQQLEYGAQLPKEVNINRFLKS